MGEVGGEDEDLPAAEFDGASAFGLFEVEFRVACEHDDHLLVVVLMHRECEAGLEDDAGDHHLVSHDPLAGDARHGGVFGQVADGEVLGGGHGRSSGCCAGGAVYRGGNVVASGMDASKHPYDLHVVAPGGGVDLAAIDPGRTPGLSGEKEHERAAAEALHAENITALRDLQYRLWAEGERSLLVVLQGMDTAGKDGTIRHVFGPLNPQGVRVEGFKQPTPEELAHDYLWRVHRRTPGRGRVVIFNRSHYEDVLVVRVHGLVPEDVWRRRYDEINAFERLLAGSGTTILKIFLHISKDEQKERLQARLDEPTKRWKFSAGDLAERKRWGEYQAAYTEAIARCSTAEAPWFVVPADRKWYRNWAVSSIVRRALEGLDPQPPRAEFDPASFVIE